MLQKYGFLLFGAKKIWFLGFVKIAIPSFLRFGESDDVVLVHVFQEHLVDEAKTQLAFQPLYMLIRFGSLWSIQLAGLVGVEPCRDSSMSGGESQTLCLLLFGRRPMARLGEMRDAYFAARCVGGEIEIGIFPILAADAFDDVDRYYSCHNIPCFLSWFCLIPSRCLRDAFGIPSGLASLGIALQR